MVYFPLLKGQDLNNWVTRRVERLGGKISRQAASFFTMAAGNSLNLLDQEIAKLLTYLGDQPQIEVHHVEDLVTKQKDITVFQLVDAVTEKRFTEAMDLVHELLFQGETPILIVSLLARQFRLIWLTGQYFSRGYSEKQVAANLQVPSFVVGKCVRQARHFREEELEQAFRVLVEADYKMKSGQQEQKVALEMAIIALCS
ncbi:MAG TPA: DNA polymerase III subunit delta [Bacillota bacterium]|nr:DNA polymerase III subunit delta [Bacillota bacterium]